LIWHLIVDRELEFIEKLIHNSLAFFLSIFLLYFDLFVNIFIVIYLWTQWRPELRLRFWYSISGLIFVVCWPLLLVKTWFMANICIIFFGPHSQIHIKFICEPYCDPNITWISYFKTYFYSNHKYMRNIWINMWKVFMKISFENRIINSMLS